MHELKNIGIVSEFNITKNITYVPGYTFVMVIFRLEDPYRNDLNYISGMFFILKHFPKYFKNFSLRIYYDDSVLMKDNKWNELFQTLLMSKYVELIRYNFPQFKVRDTFYHNGLFGTIIRLLPIFKFSKLTETTINIDIDLFDSKHVKNVDVVKQHISEIKKSKTGLILTAYNIDAYYRFLYKRLKLEFFFKDCMNFPIRYVMSALSCNKKIDKNIFLNFMECLLNKCNYYSMWINEIYTNMDCSNDKTNYGEKHICKHLKKYDELILLYGIDELFLSFIAHSLIKKKKKFEILFKFPSITHYHYFIYDYLFKNKIITYNFVDNLYKYVLKGEYNKNLDTNFKLVDHKIYDKSVNCHDNEYSLRIYNFLRMSLSNGYLLNSIKNKTRIKDFENFFSLLLAYPYKIFSEGSRSLYEIGEFLK
jgi:hypothetical protein